MYVRVSPVENLLGLEATIYVTSLGRLINMDPTLEG